ncbi:unnamed protein product, partial [Prorocentrum cordatum]
GGGPGGAAGSALAAPGETQWGRRLPLVPFDAPSLNFWAIWSGDNTSEENIALWAEYQAKMVSYLNTQFWQGQPNVSLRILVINPVQNSNLSLENFIRNYDKLTNNSFGDVFHFALFFYQASSGSLCPGGGEEASGWRECACKRH